jgi:hypothetical protein
VLIWGALGMSGSLAEGEMGMESGERGEQFASPQNEPTAFKGLGKFQPTRLGVRDHARAHTHTHTRALWYPGARLSRNPRTKLARHWG